jgi:large subunit ribosomal protein L19
MSRIIEKVRQDQARQDIPVFRPGDTVRVHVRLKEAEGEKERVQPFEGVVVSRRGHLSGATFTVRRVSFGIGVERIFPVNSPMISSIEVLQAGRVRRSKLYYLRQLKGKAARIRRADQPVEAVAEPVEKAETNRAHRHVFSPHDACCLGGRCAKIRADAAALFLAI